ncbi:uncharacterized protein IL334_005913 [Kwoniella shivajii]|uniref:NudC domain-containing protein 1 n=1 Tax=Kwoniella shivajii TaxID=564305 RepID=A0ABZ1D7J4_9TREE|nr:hypothetical protein IL334_005913 [Kwoniella shivajii]
MPDFHPPLAHSSDVTVSSNSSHPYIQLNFFATFNEDEDSSGSWEIWTDLPRLDDHGHALSQPGEWRSIQFKNYDKSAILPCGNGSNGISDQTIHIKTLDDYPVPTTGPRTMYLSTVIPASTGQEFSYTYRHITTSGETHWLGGMGGNGAIKMIEGEIQAKNDETKVGDWSEKPEGLNRVSWIGFGIELETVKGKIKPIIRTLPSSTNASLDLILLQGISPIHLSPLSYRTNVIKAQEPISLTQDLAIIGHGASFDVAPSYSLPSTTNNSLTASYGLTTQPSPKEVLTAAFRAAKAKQDRFRLGEVSGSDARDVVAIFASTGQGENEQIHMVIHAPPTAAPSQISVTLPASMAISAPIAIFSDSENEISYLNLPDTGRSAGSTVRLHLEAGPVAKVLQVAEFVELRGTGGDDSAWICAPDAINVEVGEEEIAVPKSSTTAVPDESFAEVTPSTVTEEANAPIESNLYEDRLLEGSTEESRIERFNTVHAAPSAGWWLFRFIGRFVANIWGMLLWPFRSTANITDGSEDIDDDTPLETGERPADDERTPLLGSISMSRDTSSSSTAFDPLATPTSMRANKEGLTPNHQTDGSITPTGQNSSPLITVGELPIINTVQIRSYAQMTFNERPPFRFFLPPHSVQDESKLRFRIKEKISRQWIETEPVPKSSEQDRCRELIVGEKGTVGGEDWDVQIERLST